MRRHLLWQHPFIYGVLRRTSRMGQLVLLWHRRVTWRRGHLARIPVATRAVSVIVRGPGGPDHIMPLVPPGPPGEEPDCAGDGYSERDPDTQADAEANYGCVAAAVFTLTSTSRSCGRCPHRTGGLRYGHLSRDSRDRVPQDEDVARVIAASIACDAVSRRDATVVGALVNAVTGADARRRTWCVYRSHLCQPKGILCLLDGVTGLWESFQKVARLTLSASLQARRILPSLIRAAHSLVICLLVIRMLADTVRIADGFRLTTSCVACRFIVAPKL